METIVYLIPNCYSVLATISGHDTGYDARHTARCWLSGISL